MKIDNIDVDAAIESVEELLKKEKDLSPALRAALNVLLVLVGLLLNRLTLNSRNSSKPPSSDPNRKKSSSRAKTGKKAGGQKGHNGSTLGWVETPDEVTELKLDRRRLPKGRTYERVGYEKRQVIDIKISRRVCEYQAEILEDENGNRYTASFPAGVTRPVQYGATLKATAVYMSQYQLIPYARVQEHFQDQFNITLSAGSLYNFNQEAYERLDDFEPWVKTRLAQSEVIHADETGCNIGGKRNWLHCASNDSLTWLAPHAKRGTQAMDDIGILGSFKGILCHDHWKPYYQYDCTHVLCNAHHLRELEGAAEQDKQQWAKKMQALLIEFNQVVENAGGCLAPDISKRMRQRYRRLLKQADIECPPPDEKKRDGKRGRLKRSKSRNLLERMRNFESDILRFMDVPAAPFTNNQGERDLRMTKVQQKISGCFRSWEGALMFCRIRSYLSTCRKQQVSATQALTMLFDGDMPEFIVNNRIQDGE